MRADTLRGEVGALEIERGGGGGGLAPEIEFFGPLEMARADRRVPSGAQKMEKNGKTEQTEVRCYRYFK
jgi:hypothetical protein